MGAGIWVTSGYRRGDLLIMDFDGKGIDHIGMCIDVDAAGGSALITIEGNTGPTNQSNGGEVMKRTRSRSCIVGACRPAYPSTAAMEKIISILKAEVGTKESPAGSNNVKYNTWYYGRAVSGSNYAWCVILLAWAFDKAGMFVLFMDGQKTASCTALATYYGYGKVTTSGSARKVNISLDELQRGSSGAQVTTLQRLLTALDYNCGVPDGEFGPKTDGALRAFQRDEKLTTDGVVGVKTWMALLT